MGEVSKVLPAQVGVELINGEKPGAHRARGALLALSGHLVTSVASNDVLEVDRLEGIHVP